MDQKDIMRPQNEFRCAQHICGNRVWINNQIEIAHASANTRKDEDNIMNANTREENADAEETTNAREENARAKEITNVRAMV